MGSAHLADVRRAQQAHGQRALDQPGRQRRGQPPVLGSQPGRPAAAAAAAAAPAGPLHDGDPGALAGAGCRSTGAGVAQAVALSHTGFEVSDACAHEYPPEPMIRAIRLFKNVL